MLLKFEKQFILLHFQELLIYYFLEPYNINLYISLNLHFHNIQKLNTFIKKLQNQLFGVYLTSFNRTILSCIKEFNISISLSIIEILSSPIWFLFIYFMANYY